MKSNTALKAKEELDILVSQSTDPNNRPIIEPFIPEILALVEKFGNSGQSGGSAPMTASALSSAILTLCLQEPLCEITGDASEWVNVTHDVGKPLFQNKRCSALFKTEGEDPYYLDAIVWVNDRGHGWSGNALLADGTQIRSRQRVKSFPFRPKTFQINVTEVEEPKDDWTFYVKDESQLKEVFDYYNKYN